jgi:hypothetical protein
MLCLKSWVQDMCPTPKGSGQAVACIVHKVAGATLSPHCSTFTTLSWVFSKRVCQLRIASISCM